MQRVEIRVRWGARAATMAVIIGLASGLLALAPAGSAPWSVPAARAETPGTITTYGSLLDNTGIAAGPDGNLWVAGRYAIVRVTPAGVRTSFQSPPISPSSIVAGPDGNLWFRTGDFNRSRIGKITTDGVITILPNVLDPAGELVRGADGNLWFSEPTRIGRVTPSGTFTFFAIGGFDPSNLTAGPDGNVWFNEFNGNNTVQFRLSRVTPDGTVTAFGWMGGWPSTIVAGGDGALWITDDGAFSAPNGSRIGRVTVANPSAVTWISTSLPELSDATWGPDGNLWVAADALVARITPAGVVTPFAFSPPADQYAGPSIAAGPDGNLWVAAFGWIRRVTPTGATTTFSELAITTAGGIATGADGNLWTTDELGQRVGRFTPDGSSLTWFPVPGGMGPRQIVAGPDGNLWFTTGTGIGRITTAGAVSLYPDSAGRACSGLTVGPDGAIWAACLIGVMRVTTSGAVSAPTTIGRSAVDITAGPDGNLWYVDSYTRLVHRLTPAGVVTTFDTGTPISDGAPWKIVAGQDGNLWISTSDPGYPSSLLRITPTGAVTRVLDPSSGFSVDALTVGADGNLWFADDVRDRIVRISPTPDVDGRFPRATFTHSALNRVVDMVSGPGNAVWFTNYRDYDDAVIGRVSLGGPGAPRNVTATPANSSAAIAWQAPLDDGGQPITAYQATVNPGGQSCSTAGALTCTITGLTNGQTYTVSVRATNADATGPAGTTTVTPRTIPGAPTSVTAQAGLGAASVQWAPPASDGGAPITAYTVTASPGGATCTPAAGARSCVVTGLTNGTPYTFAVRATNAAGQGPASPAAGPVTPAAPSNGPLFHALAPARILDTRPGPDQTGLAGAFGPAQARTVQVTGRGGVPAGATAVLVNVTAVLPTAGGFLSITPTPPTPGAPITTSSLNLTPGTVRPNLVVAKLDGSGRFSIYNNSGAVDVLADVVGWFDDGTQAGDVLTSVTPARILDTRPGPDQAGLAGPFGPRQSRTLQVTGRGGVPVGATAVVMNVTSVGPTADSFLSVTPDAVPAGQTPSTSNLNLAAGQVRPNLVVVKLDAEGKVSLYNNSGSVDVLADVVGYFTAAPGPSAVGATQPVTPVRILDTRPGPEQTGLAGALGPTTSRTLQVAGRGGVPAGATAVWLNVTSVLPTAPSFVSVVPGTTTATPSTSNLNLATGQVVPNLVLVKLDAAGRVTVYNNSGSVDVLADVVAYVT